MDHIRTASARRSLVPVISFFAVLILVAAGCDAPRDNTLDPKSPEFNPLGIGEIDNEPEFDVSIYVIHDERDQSDVKAFDRIVTFVQEARDLDGIEFVQLEVADSLRFMMQKSGQDYGFTFQPTRFSGSVYDFSSAPFRVIIYDKKGNLSVSEQYHIVRVLSHPPEIIQPTRGSTEGVDVLDSRPTIKWVHDTSSFEVHYLMRLRSFGPLGETIWKDWFRIDRDTETSSEIDSFRFADNLPGGENTLYFVTMAVEDNDDNLAIGVEHSFKILN